MKVIAERLKIRVDAAVRSIVNHLALGQPDFGVGTNAPPQSRTMSDTLGGELQEREDKLKEASNRGLKANSYMVYRQNLD